MKRTKTRRDIKSKLIAAICMLMVSVIMMASTSYAWFTLSTAPEVKGIQTAVGANGNLEIALLSTDDSYNNPDNISSAVGDSSAATGKSAITANITWGNLIDLSHESYGLSLITLKPAKFMVTNGQFSGEQILAVPMYGADGRVTTVTAENTILATYDATKRAFAKAAEGYDALTTINYGVRAAGGSTNRSVREMAFDTYMSQGAMSASLAKTAAANSLNAYGGFLANLGIKGTTEASATFTAADVEQLQAMINSILGYDVLVDEENQKYEHTKGIVDHIEESLKYYGIATLASSLNTTTYTETYTFEDHMKSLASASATAVADAVSEFAPDAMKTAATELATVVAIAENAKSQLNGLTGDSFTWTQISPVVGILFDSEKLTLCGMTLDQVMDEGTEDDPTSSGLVKLQTAMQEQYNNQLLAEMTGGIYSEIADLTDTFSGSAYLTVQGMTVKSVMQANKTSTVTRYYLGQTNAALASVGAPEGDTSATPSISDAYAYVIDMAFRTNASNSKLLLQTAADQRIDTSTDDTTMGAGSTMTFTSVDGFSTDNMKKLMSNIKVVFYLNEGDTKTVLATAKLDTTNATVSGNDVTAYLKIWDGTAFKSQADAVIYNMPTNSAVKISALVYLDGESITNADVGTGALSMSGSMNLQFSSSANLVPMDYSAGYAPANPVPETTGSATETTAANG